MMAYEILINPRAPNALIFDEDFDEVAAYFSDILKSNSWTALPGGVIDTYVPSSDAYEPLILEANQFRGYRVDADHYIADAKKIIGMALSLIEGRELAYDDFTLCPSTSVGLLVILMALKREGVGTLLVELPAYFGCLEQAQLLGFRVLLLPTLAQEGYVVTPDDLERICSEVDERVAVVITQPRYGMGFCRALASILALREKLRPGDFLIIDEAADQSSPTDMGMVPADGEVTILRARGLMKGLGLNSARVAVIFHPSRFRPLFAEIVDLAGGALDAASLVLATNLLSEPVRYVELLQAAQRYVQKQRQELQNRLRGLPISFSPIESGYIGTAHIFAPSTVSSFCDFQEKFLQCCRSFRMPVVRGTSMYFPYEGDREIIRINYFTTEQNIHASAETLGQVVKALKR